MKKLSMALIEMIIKEFPADTAKIILNDLLQTEGLTAEEIKLIKDYLSNIKEG